MGRKKKKEELALCKSQLRLYRCEEGRNCVMLVARKRTTAVLLNKRIKQAASADQESKFHVLVPQ
jgi:hypothetical protein